jgi:iron complex outermembrane recepter protein
MLFITPKKMNLLKKIVEIMMIIFKEFTCKNVFNHLKIHSFIFLIFILCSFAVSGQKKQKKSKVAVDNSEVSIETGKLTGRAVSIQNNKEQALEFASVSVFKGKDSTKAIGGGLTDTRGIFEINDLPFGSYRLVIQSVGFDTWKSVKVKLQSSEENLGKIIIKTSSKTLDEITVSEQKQEMTMSLDKRIFNVGANLTTVGGTALDVLQNVPSVIVTPDGEIQMRGSGNLLILIDGRPSGITTSNRQSALEMLPADVIESIEIITNPSSKYQADGTSGIINIITKRSKNAGYNLRTNLNAGTREKYNGNISMNLRRGRWNVFGDYNLRDFKRLNYQRLFREQNSKNGNSEINQNSDEINRDNNQNIKLGFDFFVTKRATISGFALRRLAKDNNEENRYSTTTYPETLSEPRLYLRNGIKTGEDKGLDIFLGYKQTFDKSGQELTVDFTNINNDGYDNNDYIQSYFYREFSTPSPYLPTRTEQSRATNQNFTRILQTDYVQPLNEKTKIETGLRGSVREFDNDFSYSVFDKTSNTFKKDIRRSNRFVYNENVYAGYANYGQNWNNWSLLAGLRAEYTDLTIDQKTAAIPLKRNYLNLFPSVFLSQQIDKHQQIQLNYSRRINRPSYKALNPFVNTNDLLNLSTGNPYLQPENVNSFELTHLYFKKDFSLNSTIFYRNIQNSVVRVRQIVEGDTTLTTFQNLDQNNSYGIELIASHRLAKWLRTNGNVSVFQSDIQGQTQAGEFNRSNLSLTARLNFQVKATKNLAIQFSTNYRSPLLTPQGKVSTIYTSDLGAKYDAWKGKLSINLKVNDVFNTQQQTIYTDGLGFNAINFKKNETRYLMLGIQYRLYKKLKNPTEQRERKKVNEEQAGDEQ